MKERIRHAGITLLETSIMLVLFLVAILGAVDTTHLIRAHSAIKEAATAGLRCLTPIDGACVDKNLVEKQEPIYKVYKTNGLTERYVNQYQYDGTTRELAGGLFTFSGGTATVLDKAFSPAYRFNAVSNRFSADGEVKIITRRIPFVSASSVANREPVFIIRNGSSSAPALAPIVSRNLNTTLIFNSASDQTIRSGDRLEFRTTFRIPKPSIASSAPFSRCLTQNSRGFSEGCSTIDDQLNNQGNILLFIQGTSRGIAGAPTRGGHIDLSLEYDRDTIPLGGRDFIQSSSNNYATLIPRGANTDYLDKEIVKAYPTETTNHQNLTVPYDSDIKLTVKIRPDWSNPNKDVSWTAEKLTIYTSSYSVLSEIQRCKANLLKSEVATNSCVTVNNLTAYGLKNIAISETDRAPEDLGCFLTEDEASANLNDPELTVERTTNACPEKSYESICPENFGAISDSEAAFACPFNPEIAVRTTRSVLKPEWSEKEIQLNAPPFNAQIQTCINSKPVVPEEYSKYKKLNFSQGLEASGTVIAEIPDQLRDKTLPELLALPEYNCGYFTVQSGADLSDREIPFFNSTQPDLGCGWEEEVIRAAALPRSVEITPKKFTVGSEKVAISDIPDSCTPFEERPLKDLIKTYLGEYRNSEIPESCDGKCIVEFARYDTNISKSPKLDYEAAKNTALLQASVIMPDANRLKIEFAEENQKITASTSLTIPLLLKKTPYTVRYNESAVRE